MENKSILEQIINNQRAEEVARLDAVEIINNILSQLSERERDVITRRFGLHGKSKETLEEIGKVHQLTRERIRQIETTAVKKLKQLDNLESYIAGLKKVISQLLDEHGGLMEKNYLLNNLVSFSADESKAADPEVHKNHLDFLIAKLLTSQFEELNDSSVFKNSFKLKFQSLDHLEELAKELLEKIKETKKVFITEELINLAKNLQSFKTNQEKFAKAYTLDISHVLGGEHFQENAELVNANKIIYSILQAAREIEQNKFGHWGHISWREIKPKTINDKIYLILKNNGKPMHFTEIADKINQISFDKKTANAATVHNELILDDKYILVGRGLYGLKEWGYEKGTVADIIANILAEGKTLSREEIIEKVLAQRLVRKATINLALMNKNKFERIEGGKYRVKQ